MARDGVEFLDLLEKVREGDESAPWEVVAEITESFLLHYPELRENFRPFLKWRYENAFGKGRRKFALAIAAAYAREYSSRFRDAGIWDRMHASLSAKGFNPPSSLENWALRDQKKDRESSRLYQQVKRDVKRWSDADLRSASKVEYFLEWIDFPSSFSE